jgi:heptosyltransferase-2
MRFLIAQTSFLGDVVLSTPVFTALRHHYADAHITALVRPETAGVLDGHPDVDVIMTDDKRGRERGFGSWRVVRKLRGGQFDTVLALHKSFRTAWMLAAAGIKRRIGFRQSGGWFLYHHRVQRDPTRHDVERNLSILAGLGLDPAAVSARPFVACHDEAVLRFHAALRFRNADPEALLIGVAPGSAWATKRWTVEGYAALLIGLHRELDAVPVLLGGSGDVPYAEAILRAAGGIGINLVGQTDLRMLVAAIDQCQVLVANDSAPVHIAVARDTPVVAIFGPTVPQQGFAPYTNHARIVERPLSCRPCGQHGSARCPIGTHACMREISAAQVQDAVLQLLPGSIRASVPQPVPLLH